MDVVAEALGRRRERSPGQKAVGGKIRIRNPYLGPERALSVGNDIVIDASVFVASSLRDEPHHGEAHAMLLSFSDVMPHIHLPSLALLEVASAVARRTGRAAQAKRLAEALADIPGVTLYELSFEHARQGLELLEQGPLRAADIVYVILALQVRAELITLDKEMHKHARSLVRVRRPSEWMRGF